MGSLPNRSSFPQPCFRCDLDRMVREVYGDVNSKNGDDSDGFLTHFDSGMFGESGDVVTASSPVPAASGAENAPKSHESTATSESDSDLDLPPLHLVGS